jgi:large subunit ribosomal protein L21
VVEDPRSLAGARVVGEVVGEGKARKITVVKFKRRKNYRRTRGHRQPFVGVRITKIEE